MKSSGSKVEEKQGEEGGGFLITKFAAMPRIQSRPPVIFITSRNQTLQVIQPIKFNLNNKTRALEKTNL